MDRQDAYRPADSSQTFHRAMHELAQMPLFMTNIDDATEADGDNVVLDAIQALQYEGTKAEIAQNFKDQGNEMVKSKMWGDAKEFYTKAIMVLTDQSEDRWERGEDAEVECRREDGLAEQCYTNRALCHLELKNYRSTTIDCACALRLNRDNVKALYRSASALLALRKLEEARDVCVRGLNLDPGNDALKKLSGTIQSRKQSEDLRARNRVIEEHRRQRERSMLAAALKARNIMLQGSTKPPDLEDAEIHLSPDPIDPQSMLVFPVVLLYPMHAQSDLIKHFAESDSIAEHLDYIFPLPWDSQHQYQFNSVNCYVDTVAGGIVKAGKKVSLLQVLSTGQTQVVDGLVRIHIVPIPLAAKWIEEMKKRTGRAG